MRSARVFTVWARWVIRHRFLALAATLALTAMASLEAHSSLRSDTSDESFLADGADASRVLEQVRAQFGRDAVFQVLVGGDVFSVEYLQRLQRLHRALEQIDIPLEETPPHRQDDAPTTGAAQAQAGLGDDFAEGFGDADWGEEAGGSVIDQVISLINVRHTEWRDGGVRIGDLLPNVPAPEALPALKRRVLADATLVGQVVDRTGRHSVLLVRTRELGERGRSRMHGALRALARAHSQPGFEVQVAGGPAVSAAMRDMLLSDTGMTMALSSAVMLLITFLLFRHPLGVVGPFLVVWQAEAWTLGAMAVTDTPLTMVTSILPAFIGCVGLGDSVHIQSVYRSARASGMDNDDAIVHALGSTGVPVLLTTLTTAVGLLSFRLASLGAIQEMGTFGALGVTGALVNSVVFLPAVLTFNRKSLLGLREQGGDSDLVGRVVHFFERLSAPVPGPNGLSHHRRNLVLAVTGVVAVLACAGAARLRVHHDGLDWFPSDHPTRVAIDALEASVGGTANLALLIEAPRDQTLRSRPILVGMEALERHLLRYDDGSGPGQAIRNVTSLLDPIREAWRALHEDAPDHYAVPDSQRGVSDMFTLLENTAPDALRSLMTLDARRTVMTVRVTWRDALAYMPVLDHMQRGVSRFLDGVADARPTGSVYVAVVIVNALLDDLLRSFGTAAAVITVLMIFMLRDVKLGLFAMLPNLLPVIIVLGLMALTGIPLDTSTLMLGSVAIGIVVDDTIHFLHQFKSAHDATGDAEAAVQHAFVHTGRAMVATSLILVAGFLCVLGTQLLSSRIFGVLVAVTVVVALLLDFTFTPALLRLLYSKRAPAGGRRLGRPAGSG